MKKLTPMPKVTPREPWDDDRPNGYMECDSDYFDHNREACVWFLDNAEVIRAILFPKKPHKPKL